MKKQIAKLKLSKKTILNLNQVEMNQKAAGLGATFKCITEWKCTVFCATQKGHTCNGGCI